MNIFLLGDSTLQYNDETTYPQVGWGQVFSKYVKEDTKVINLGKNGASTKTFIKGPLFKVYKDNVKQGDLVLIQFGHNDGGNNPICHTSAYEDFTDNLLYIINIAKKANATPILLTPTCKRIFINHKAIDAHKDYAKAIHLLALKENILLIDINQLMIDQLNLVGEEESKKYFMVFDKNIYKNYINGLNDNTHLREDGAILVCNILIQNLNKSINI